MVVSEQSERAEIFALLRQKHIYLVLLCAGVQEDEVPPVSLVFCCVGDSFPIFSPSLLACQSDVETLVHLLSMVIITFFFSLLLVRGGGGAVCPPPPPVGTLLRLTHSLTICIQNIVNIFEGFFLFALIKFQHKLCENECTMNITTFTVPLYMTCTFAYLMY